MANLNTAPAHDTRKPFSPVAIRTNAASSYITSETLFAGARELIIAHAGHEYRLRLTNQGKLILTK